MRKGLLLLGAAAMLSVPNVFGQTKKVVIEEKTGTWCGFCPRGTVGMADAEENEDNFIGIAIHDSDPMENSVYNTASNDLPGFTGYPHCAGDRAVGNDPSNIPSIISDREDETVAGSVNVGANYDSDDNTIYITVSVRMDSDETGDWRLGAIVVENNVTGSSSGYAQSNYYDGGGYGALDGAGHDWTTAGNPVPAADMEYDHVGRKLANDEYSGDDESLPETLVAGETYYYNYEVTKQSFWDENELHVVAILVEPDGTINNAEEVTVTPATNSIDEVESAFNIFVYPNPTTDATNIKVETEEASDVTVEIYNMMGELVYTESNSNLAAGKYYYNVDVTDFASGMYTVKTTVNNSVKTAKLSVK